MSERILTQEEVDSRKDALRKLADGLRAVADAVNEGIIGSNELVSGLTVLVCNGDLEDSVFVVREVGYVNDFGFGKAG